MFDKVVWNPGFVITNCLKILQGLGVVLQDVGAHLLGSGQHPRHAGVDVVCGNIFIHDLSDELFVIMTAVKANKGDALIKEEGKRL